MSLVIDSMNVILYCRRWREAVAFYRDVLGFRTRTAADWLVEFEAGPHMCLSVADAGRTSMQPAEGAGITVTFKVADARSAWQELANRSVKAGPLRDSRLGGQAFFLRDPEGNRLEIWSEDPSPTNA